MSRLSLTVALAFVLLAGYCLDHSQANKTGITHQSRTGCGGGCHGFSASSKTSVKIWADSAQLTVGKQYTMHVSVINAVQTQTAGGCNITVDNGKLAVSGTGSGLWLSSSELTHTAPKSKDGDSITWTFLYTPSKAGNAHIYAAGNAVNGDGRESIADQWNMTSLTLTIAAAAPMPAISLPSSAHSFALLGVPDTQNVTVRNTGSAPLNITRFALAGGSAWSIIDSSAHTVAAADSVKIKVRLAATNLISYPDTLRIWSNDAESPGSVALIGIGAAATIRIDNLNVNVGQQKLGSSNTTLEYIYNIGTGNMTISQNKIVSASGAFTLVKPAALPATLGKGGGFVIDSVRFSPVKAGLDTATIQLSFTQTDTALRSTIIHDTSILFIGEGMPTQSVAEEQSKQLIISPNPSHGIVIIQSSIDLNAASYEVIDVVGRTVQTQGISANTLDLSALPNGTYFLCITPKQSASQLRRIVIEH